MTAAGDISLYNVAFEDRSVRKSLSILHILQEYDMEIPDDDRDMTLFVAKRETLEQLLDYICQFLSEDGVVKEAGCWSDLTFRFRDKRLRTRFCNGSAKFMTMNDFCDIFACKCTEDVSTVCRTGMASAHMTLFLNDVRRQLVGEPTISRRASMLYLLRRIYPKLTGIRDKKTKARSPVSDDLWESYSQSLIRGCPLPPLTRDSRSRPKVGFLWDMEKLYRWSKA